MYAGDVHEGIIRIFLKAKKAAENLIIGGSGTSIMRTEDRKTTSFGALLKMPRERKFGLTSGGARPCADIFFNAFARSVVAPGGSPEKVNFFVASVPRIFAESLEIRFDRPAARHHSGRLRSKYFKKSEKKACQPSQTPVILTAKPNQTIGETNDKKRTAHVWILPHSSRSCCGSSSRPRG
jgi:hypothetical protein